MLGAHHVVRTGRDRGEVGRHRRCRREVPRDYAVGVRRPRRPVRVLGRDDLPARRTAHGELERGLQVGLVEAGPDLAGVGGLEIGVEIDAVVGRIGEPVQAVAAVGVGAPSLDRQLVDTGQFRQLHAVIVEQLDRQRPSVQGDPRDLDRGQVDEGRGARSGASESNRGQRPEAGGAAVQVKLDSIRLQLQQASAIGRLSASQVACHRLTPGLVVRPSWHDVTPKLRNARSGR